MPPVPPEGGAPGNPSITPAELAQAAHEFVRRAVALELDGSVESLAFVDHYLGQIGEMNDEVLALISAAVGAYFGEIVSARIGGTWSTLGEPTDWTITLDPVPVTFSPAGMVAEAIRMGDADGYDGSISVPGEVEALLAEALAASGPVDERYYYSLTGRLETLEHIVEILVELQRHKRMSKAD
jgi:hypothetical protein